MWRWCRWIVVFVLLLPVTGCMVPEGRYLQKCTELESLTAEQFTLQQRHDALKLENQALKETSGRLSLELATATDEKKSLGEKVTRLENERKELVKDQKSSQSESLQRIFELRQKVADLESHNDRLRLEVSGLKQEMARIQQATENEILATSAIYEQLLEMMKNEISLGEIAISELKGRLTVKIVDAILFQPGKTEVKAGGLALLQKMVRLLKTVKDKSIRVEGHTDNVPVTGQLAARYPGNWELSAARAVNVARYLQEQGIDPQLLSAAANGEYKPVSANDSEEGRARNRRIEIILMPK